MKARYHIASVASQAAIGIAWLAYFGEDEVRAVVRDAQHRLGAVLVGGLAVGVVVGAVALGAALAVAERAADAVLEALDGEPDPATTAWAGAAPGGWVH